MPLIPFLRRLKVAQNYTEGSERKTREVAMPMDELICTTLLEQNELLLQIAHNVEVVARALTRPREGGGDGL